MIEYKIIERICELTKEEPISTLSSDLVLPDTVVFEAVSPFFGYYNDAPLAEKEPYLYFALESCCSINELTRAANKILKQIKHPMDVASGSIELANRKLPVIRIKSIGKYCRIKHLQKYFADEGIFLSSSLNQIDNEMVVIRLQKYITFRQVGEGLYLDVDDASKGYFELPKYHKWDEFKDLTREAKYDTSILYFDAAQAVIIEKNRVIDLVRIYREHLTVDKLSDIRDRYIKVLTGTAIKKTG